MPGLEPSPLWIAPTPPLAVRTPMMTQAWRDCVFLHWRYPPSAVRPHVPASLELDLLDGDAWVSSITFGVPHLRLGPLPRVPGLDHGAESNLRTYVVDRAGRRGLWMLGMDFTPLPAVLAGRFPFLLPYWWATIGSERTPEFVAYDVHRRPPGRGDLYLEVMLGRDRGVNELTERDHFLTARWLLYGGVDGWLLSVLSNHRPWSLREAAVVELRETILAAAGLPDPGDPPLAQFSDGVVARLDRPRAVPDRRGAAA